jgi:hypothetical protein
MWFTIFSKTSTLSAPGASFWSKAELMTHSKFIAVGDHLGNGSVNTEVESSLNFELLDFIANVFDHFVQLMEVLLVDVNNVRKQIHFLLLFFNGCLQFGDLDGVVGGQRECGGGGDKRSDVPLPALTFLHVRKACQKIIEEFEHLFKCCSEWPGLSD